MKELGSFRQGLAASDLVKTADMKGFVGNLGVKGASDGAATDPQRRRGRGLDFSKFDGMNNGFGFDVSIHLILGKINFQTEQ